MNGADWAWMLIQHLPPGTHPKSQIIVELETRQEQRTMTVHGE